MRFPAVCCLNMIHCRFAFLIELVFVSWDLIIAVERSKICSCLTIVIDQCDKYASTLATFRSTLAYL